MEAQPGSMATAQDRFRREWIRCQPRIYAFIRSFLPHRPDAEDLLQDVAEVLWKKIDQFAEGTRFDLWACQVARNLVLNQWRKKDRSRVLFSSRLTEQLADEAAADQGQPEELEALEACLQGLPVADRELIRERYLAGAKLKELASALGKSEATVSRAVSRIHRALLQCVSGRLNARKPGEVGT